jgi:DNA-binding response OmpR family regulator
MIERDKIHELKACGADDFLQKPFDTDVLVSRICSLLTIEPSRSAAAA